MGRKKLPRHQKQPMIPSMQTKLPMMTKAALRAARSQPRRKPSDAYGQMDRMKSFPSTSQSASGLRSVSTPKPKA
jgi:hypothetical protein